MNRLEAKETAKDLFDDQEYINGDGSINYAAIAAWVSKSGMLKPPLTAQEVQSLDKIPRTTAMIRQHLKKKRGALVLGASTVACVMWDCETKKFYTGKSGHKKNQGYIPAAIWNKIPIVDDVERAADWAFGRNCAEVECVRKMFQGTPARKKTLAGCTFAARHKSAGAIGPCRTCNMWIPTAGGKCIK